MTVTTTNTQHSTPDSRAAHWNSLAESKEANAAYFDRKAQEFQDTLDQLKADENQTTDTENAIREATLAKAEAEEQAHAYTAMARDFRDRAGAETGARTN